jgi:hypothetical protein
VKNAKIAFVSFVLNKPIHFRVGMSLVAILAGTFHAWFGTETTMDISLRGLGLLVGLSTLVYVMVLTLYRIFQRIFKRRIKTENGEAFDERLLVRAAGIFWFIPYGSAAYFLSDTTGNFGLIMIVQGLSLTMSAWLSQQIKK